MMSWSWMCWLWSLVGAGLLGWGLKGVLLQPWVEGRNREIDRLTSKVEMLMNQPPTVQTVEQVVEAPVEKIVEQVVDRLVDNPVHLTRIGELEEEVAVLGELRQQLARLEAASPMIIEKIVEVPVERVVEKRVGVPVETVVEKIVDRLVDNPVHLARIAELEGEVARIAALQQQLAQLRSASQKAREKTIQKRVAVPVEESVKKVASRNRSQGEQRPIKKLVTKGHRPAESDDLKKIYGVGPNLRARAT